MRFRLPGPAATALAAVLLVACATPAERELHKVSLASEKLWAEYDLCIARVEGTGAYRRLNRDYILMRNDPRSVEKMAIERPASDQERADLLQNHKNETQCNRELFKGFAEINPGFNVLLSRFMNEDDELVLQTIQGKLTVGSRNRIVQQRFAQRMRDWNFAGERIVRLHTWRLRRTCSIYCSSFSAASLLPTSTAGVANLAGVTPLPPSADDAAFVSQFEASPEPAVPAGRPAANGAAPVPMAQAPNSEIGLAPAAGPLATPKTKQPVRLAAASRTAERPVYMVHLATLDSQVEAQAEWDRLQSRFPSVLSERFLLTRQVAIDDQGSLVRVLILAASYDDAADAGSACQELQDHSQYCAVYSLK